MAAFFFMKTQRIIQVGVLFTLTAVILGAMGAHALKPHLQPEQLMSFETAVRYQFYHGIALLLLAALSSNLEPKFLSYAFRLFCVGILLFSGSIYLLALRDLIGLSSYKWLGPITPIGGICFIAGWILFFMASKSHQSNQ